MRTAEKSCARLCPTLTAPHTPFSSPASPLLRRSLKMTGPEEQLLGAPAPVAHQCRPELGAAVLTLGLDGVLPLARVASPIDPEEGPAVGKLGFAQGVCDLPSSEHSDAGPAVCTGIWPTYKNVMGSLMAMGGRDLFPTC